MTWRTEFVLNIFGPIGLALFASLLVLREWNPVWWDSVAKRSIVGRFTIGKAWSVAMTALVLVLLVAYRVFARYDLYGDF